MPIVLQPNVKSSQINKNVVAEISVKFGLARPLAEVLYTRGYDSVEKVASFLSNELDSYKDPYLLSGMKETVELIKQYITDKKRITLYGDYDVDGICAVAILYLTLRHMNADVHYYIPDRHSEGYGLNLDAVKSIAVNGGLLLTVDCGITSVNEVDFAKSLGMEVIVTDHHNLPMVLPDCVVVNPKIESEYGFDQLCGAGVAFKIAHALLEKVEFVEELSDLAAIATVADVVPLVNENKYIVKRGLYHMNTHPRPGIYNLITESGRKPGEITASDISFALAPRLNAAGRLEKADIALNVLLGNNISDNVIKLCLLNTKRQEMEQSVIDEAELIALKSGQVRLRRVIVAASDNWDKGVIGIAASKLAEKYHRPCILFSVSDGIATGSGRSVEGVDLFDALSQFNQYYIRFGGHSMAAGLSINVQDIDDFAQQLNEYITENADPKVFFPVAKYDARVCLAEINPMLVTQMQQLSPFGMGNPMPRFRVDGLRSTVCRTVGKKRNHMKIALSDDATSVETMLFNYKNSSISIKNDFDYTVVGYPELSVWNDVERISFILSSVRMEKDYKLIKDAIIHNDDKLFSTFFEQIMYEEDMDSDDYQTIENIEELEQLTDELLSQDTCGTLVVCNHPTRAIKVSKYILDNHPRCDIDFFKTTNDINGYNALTIGVPLEKINFDSYCNVILCDCCNKQQISYLNEKYPHLDIYAMFDSISNYLKPCSRTYRSFDRDTMVKIYLAIKNESKINTVYENKESFLRCISVSINVSKMVVNIALKIFNQLGFMTLYDDQDGNVKLDFKFDAPQNPLTNSKIYNNLQKVSL